ncbi:hypothetical protein [Hymenobacter sp. B1770]|uniref:hypothetical protein n=1 Tax=Hymenobacter sp. B1770 TaxID=1718788 RepID=UPI003CF21C18
MDALAILAAREKENIRITESVTGTIEHQTHHLKSLGVFDEYKSIHKAYTQLLTNDHEEEALKGALFIQWFALSEPSFVSGIDDIDLEAELTVNTRLDQLLSFERTDAELTAMLQYYSTWEYVFQRHQFMHLRALQTFVASVVTGAAMDMDRSLVKIEKMPERGAMRRYWLSWSSSGLS